MELVGFLAVIFAIAIISSANAPDRRTIRPKVFSYRRKPRGRKPHPEY
jgi:hypothetical protein